jgi:hypothetical protein
LDQTAESQNRLLKEEFNEEYLLTSYDSLMKSRIYGIDVYSPNKKFAINLISNSRQYPYTNFYKDYPCEDTSKKNFFISITAYDKVVDGFRTFVVLRLDTPVIKKKHYQVSMKLKFEPCMAYDVDSLGFCFFNSEKDISIFLKGQLNSKERIHNISLKEVKSDSWRVVEYDFYADKEDFYIMIGNFGLENQVKAKKNTDCCKDLELKKFIAQSEILIDDIFITEL